MYPKYYESYAFSLAHEMSFVYFSLFWLKKVHFEAKFTIFFTCMLIKFFVRTAQSAQKRKIAI